MKSNKTDIVYLLGTGSRMENVELRFSLRSISRFAKNVNDVYVVGDIPDFLSNKVKTLSMPFKDEEPLYKRKHFNMLHRLNVARKHFNITKPFLVSSDDHFLTRQTDFAWGAYPIYCRFNANEQGFIYNEEEWQKLFYQEKGHFYMPPYNKSLVQTRNMLESENLPPLWTCWHGNTWIFPDVLDEAEELVCRHQDKVHKLGFEPTCVVTALKARKEMEAGRDFTISVLPCDVKSSKFEVLRTYAIKRGSMSVSDRVWKDEKAVAFLNGMYFTPCEYEKEYKQ
jgi:hypothetical protein